MLPEARKRRARRPFMIQSVMVIVRFPF